MSRTVRVAERIKEEVGQIIHDELSDPRLGFLTVLSARVTADLQHAHIYVSCFGEQPQREQSLAILTQASGHVRKLLGQRMRLRYTPAVEFHLDDTVDTQMRMQDTIDHLHEEPPPDVSIE